MREQLIPVFFDEQSASSTQYSNTIQGIRSAASKYGAHLVLHSEKDLDTISFSTLPPVVILTSASMPFLEDVISRLRAADKHAVLAGSDSELFGPDVSCATPSRRAETQQLVNYLYHCGKKRLALVGFGSNSINDNFRYHAAMSAAAAWGRFLKEEDTFQWQHDPCTSFDAFFKRAGKYDAVICPNDLMAIYFINYCKTKGLQVPEELFVAAFGNMAIGRFFRPSITTMTMDTLCVGEQAFNVWRFLTLNNASRLTALKLTVPARILVRESTAEMHMETGKGVVSPKLEADRFYYNPTISVLVAIENCISQRDELDMRIIQSIMDRLSYEEISDQLFISGSTLRYRLNKIYSDAGIKTRQEFEALISGHLGEGNPFSSLS